MFSLPFVVILIYTSPKEKEQKEKIKKSIWNVLHRCKFVISPSKHHVNSIFSKICVFGARLTISTSSLFNFFVIFPHFVFNKFSKQIVVIDKNHKQGKWICLSSLLEIFYACLSRYEKNSKTFSSIGLFALIHSIPLHLLLLSVFVTNELFVHIL